jgi:hypothetical protein
MTSPQGPAQQHRRTVRLNGFVPDHAILLSVAAPQEDTSMTLTRRTALRAALLAGGVATLTRPVRAQGGSAAASSPST